MMRILKELAKIATAIVLGSIYMWFFLSFAWSFDEMSSSERTAGMLYILILTTVPAYYSFKCPEEGK